MFSLQSIVNALRNAIRGITTSVPAQKLVASVGRVPSAEAVPQPGAGTGAVGFSGVSPVGRAVASPSYSPPVTSTPTPIRTFIPPSASIRTFTPSPVSVIGAGKAPTTTPLSAPQPTAVPPAPTGGAGFTVTAGGGGGAPSAITPRESALPPTPTLPADAVGKYEAMMRSLLQQYGNVGKVPVPLAGAAPFGVGSAFGDILKQLQQRVRV